MTSGPVDFTLVVACYNEEPILEASMAETFRVLDALRWTLRGHLRRRPEPRQHPAAVIDRIVAAHPIAASGHRCTTQRRPRRHGDRRHPGRARAGSSASSTSTSKSTRATCCRVCWRSRRAPTSPRRCGCTGSSWRSLDRYIMSRGYRWLMSRLIAVPCRTPRPDSSCSGGIASCRCSTQCVGSRVVLGHGGHGPCALRRPAHRRDPGAVPAAVRQAVLRACRPRHAGLPGEALAVPPVVRALRGARVKALREVGAGRVVRFLWASVLLSVLRRTWLPPMRAVFLRLCGATDRTAHRHPPSVVHQRGSRRVPRAAGRRQLLPRRRGPHRPRRPRHARGSRDAGGARHGADAPERRLSRSSAAGRVSLADGGRHVRRGSFIGAGATILAGTSVGPEAFVAAASLVNRDVAERETVGGVPIRTLGSGGVRP